MTPDAHGIARGLASRRHVLSCVLSDLLAAGNDLGPNLLDHLPYVSHSAVKRLEVELRVKRLTQVP